jgi:NADH:ubiquinone oxidoreductase subunit C
VTDSQPDMTESASAATAVEDFAGRVAELVGGTVEAAVDTVKISVEPGSWVEALTKARDELGLVYFSWLAGVEWTNETATGDPLEEEVEEHFEVLCTVGDLTEGRRVTFSTIIPHDNPVLDTLVPVYAGANWHERETAEMYGIDFEGHPNLIKLYLPENFLGHPLRKSYALLSREVKPWPGKVDVESMPEDDAPTTENPEA